MIKNLKITDKISINIDMSDDLSLDEFMGAAEMIKSIKKSIDKVDDKIEVFVDHQRTSKKKRTWTSEDDLYLITNEKFQTGRELAEKLNRTVGAVHMRLITLRNKGMIKQ